MNATEIKTNHTKYNLQSWSKQKGLNPIAVEKGEGIYFWDYDGSRYTDMSSQLVNLNVGFGCHHRRHQGAGGEVLLRRPELRLREPLEARRDGR